jgi:octaprenyl-diphosphate synthase
MSSSSFSSQLAPLLELTTSDRKEVDSVINHALEGGLPITSIIGSHILKSGGKRLRPLLCIGTARMCGYKGSQLAGPAACMELLHSASLLHDDVIDESSARRDQPTAHSLWGNKRAILVGDYIFAQTLAIMDQCKTPGVIEQLSWASSMLAQGELLQLYWLERLDTSEKAYLNIVKHKTAALFSVATTIGGLLAGAKKDEISRLHSLGEEIGMAFQIVDDLLDYTGNAQIIKKDVGRDFAEKKLTYPMIIAMTLANTEEQVFWHELLHSPSAPSEKDREKALSIMRRHLVFETVRKKAEERIKKARMCLATFEDNIFRNAMEGFLNYCESRIA